MISSVKTSDNGLLASCFVCQRWWQRGREHPLNIFELCIIDIMWESFYSGLQVWTSRQKYRLSQICHLRGKRDRDLLPILLPPFSFAPSAGWEFITAIWIAKPAIANTQELLGLPGCSLDQQIWITVVTNWWSLFLSYNVSKNPPSEVECGECTRVQTHLQIFQLLLHVRTGLMDRNVEEREGEREKAIWTRCGHMKRKHDSGRVCQNKIQV